MNTYLNRVQTGDVYGSIASNNIFCIDGTGASSTLLRTLADGGNTGATYNPQLRDEGYASSIRPPPHDFFGRDEIKLEIIRTLLDSKSALVLGGGGIGKTAVALTVLHDPAIIDHFGESRCFISCEGLDNMDIFLQRLAETLGIVATNEHKSLESQILTVLGSSNILLCIDNLETLWDSPHTRRIEEIIAKFIHLPTAAVLVTMRGVQRPFEPKWETVHELKPLFDSPSSQVFCSAADISVNNMDNYGKLLVDAADGVPLALTLLGHLIRPAVDTPKDVWERWKTRKTAMLSCEKGTRDPHLSIDTSIEFSLESQRVRADPFAKATLGILSLLPDGIPRDSELWIIKSLGLSIRGGCGLEKSLSTLTDVSLAFIENSPSRRYQILSPVREYARSRLDSILPRNQQIGLVRYFVRLINENNDYTHPRCFPVREELVNIHSILIFAYELLDNIVKDKDLARASIHYTNWSAFIGVPVEDIICLAEKHFRKDIRLLSDIYRVHGNIHLSRDRLDDAENSLKKALQLHQQAHDSFGQAEDLWHLGELYLRLDKRDRGERALTYALALHRQVRDSIGQAKDLWGLGQLYLRINKLDLAEKALTKALELCQQASSFQGQGNILRVLGNLYLTLGKHDCAKQALTDALRLHQSTRNLAGQACDLMTLGELYIRLDEPDRAEQVLTDALELLRNIQSSLGRGYALRQLGKAYMRLGKLDLAEEAFTEALKLYRKAQSLLGQGCALQNLGGVYMELDKLGHAEEVLMEALMLHQQAQDSLCQANDLEVLSELYMKLDKPDLARKALAKACELHQRCQSTVGLARNFDILGEPTVGNPGSRRRIMHTIKSRTASAFNFHKSILMPWKKRRAAQSV